MQILILGKCLKKRHQQISSGKKKKGSATIIPTSPTISVFRNNACANRTHHKQTEFFVCVQGTARSLSWVMHWPAIPGTRFRAGFVYNMGDEEARSLVVLVVRTPASGHRMTT